MSGNARENPQRYGESLHEFLLAHSKFLEDRGILLKTPLGEGKDGVVYYDVSSKFLDKNYKVKYHRVIKFTISDDEVEIASWLKDNYQPNFPEVYWTWGADWDPNKDYPLLFYGEPVFAFGREALDHCMISTAAISMLEHMANVINPYIDFDKAAARIREIFNQTRSQLPDSEHEITEQFSDFLIWCHANNISVSDIHPKNLGQRVDSTIVLRDFGHCLFY